MNRYLAHIQSKTPHDRRQHAMQLSAAIVAAVFVVWISTIGLRFASPADQSGQNGDTSQVANIVSGAQNGQAALVVATTTQN